MYEQPLNVLVFLLFSSLKFGGKSGRDIEVGDVERLVVSVAEEVEGEVEKAGEILAFFDVFDVVILDFEGLSLLVLIVIWKRKHLQHVRDGQRPAASSRDSLSETMVRFDQS